MSCPEFPINVNDRITDIQVAVAGQTVLTYDFPVFEDDHLAVTRWRDGVITVLTLGMDYQVEDVCAENGGTITLLAPADEGDQFVVGGATPKERLSDYTQRGQYRAEVINRDLDLIIFMIQEMCEKLMRAALAPIGETGITWPPASERDEYRYIVWVDGQPVMSQQSMPPLKEAVAAENLSAGTVINLFDDNGVTKARRATAINPGTRLAHAFVVRDWQAGEVIHFHTQGVAETPWGIVPGKPYFLHQLSGRVTDQIFMDGATVQFCGWGISNNAIAFRPILPIVDEASQPAIVSEALSAGQLVNLYVDAGVTKVRLANATGPNPKLANGFVKLDWAAGATARVYGFGNVELPTAIVPGQAYYLSKVAGAVTDQMQSGNDASQFVGWGISPNTIAFRAVLPIEDPAVRIMEFGEAISAKRMVFEGDDGKAYLGDASGTGVFALIGMSLEAGAAGDLKRVAIAGQVSVPGADLTANKLVIMKAGGTIGQGKPNDLQYHVPIGRALSADLFLLDIDPPIRRII